MAKRPDDDHPDLGIEEPNPEWDDDDPIVAEQPATWVYWNTRGQVNIRQRAEVFEDDPWVTFNIENVPALIRALHQKIVEWNTCDDDPEPQPKPKPAKHPLSNAERQRRHKRRLRKGNEKGNEDNAEGNESSLPGNADRNARDQNRDIERDEPEIPFPGDEPR
jgi:hypothetical protein